ncbi:rRNA-processing protein EFG1 [Purpureocillium lavendulum]|uniref:rRNA-processing protein EFG1 n=1 Tax=Purpureocillium lavendulum TaxID=1247861 RepID=A0AB34G5J3_9HYPO|nr:rRNA-processing protein EFG1 [Purpureocillium lavendulum]
MGSKRPLADADDHDGDSSTHPKRRKFYGSGKHKAKEGTSEFAKKRVRNIQRLLQRKDDLPANVRNDLERELAALRTDVADRAFQKKRSAMIAKYHMVRFFERKKASRLVKQLKRQLEADPRSDDIVSLKQQLHVAEVDEAYTLYHPHAETYISLYGSAKPSDGDEGAEKTPTAKLALEAERPPMWKEVERTMEEGAEALKRLRERRSADGSTPAPKRPPPKKPTGANNTQLKPRQEQKQKPETQEKAAWPPQQGVKSAATGERAGAKTQLNRRERRRLMRETAAEDDADSDGGGGFFEEM